MDLDRLKYLVLRCKTCKNMLTKLEVIERWEAMESRGGKEIGLCPCGSRHVSPSNMTPEEVKRYESLWQKFRYYVLRIDDEGTKVWKLYDKCVKGKDLGEIYQSES